jgi:hypothetical protein
MLASNLELDENFVRKQQELIQDEQATVSLRELQLAS